jgi:hypothetical protein
LFGLNDTSLFIHQLHLRSAHSQQRSRAMAPDLAGDLAHAAQELRLGRRGLGLGGRDQARLLRHDGTLREAHGLRPVPRDQVDPR